MGQTVLQVEVGNPAESGRTETLDFLVDSGAEYSVAPMSVLQRLGIKPLAKHEFCLSDGTRRSRGKGIAKFKYREAVGEAWVVFGEDGDCFQLGATTLQALNLILDPLKRELRPLPTTLNGYERSLVICLDVLGFSEMVESPSSTASDIEAVFDTLHSLQESVPRKGKYHTVSDTAVLRVPLAQQEGGREWWDIEMSLDWAAESQRTILRKHKLMTRGGVARGWSALSKHSDVFGPALDEAHRMESLRAYLPRVIVDRSAVPMRWQGSFCAEEFSKVVCLNDGSWFLDYLVVSKILPIRPGKGWDNLLTLLQCHREAVLKYAEKAKSPEQLSRCAWACFLHNSTVRRANGEEGEGENDIGKSELRDLLISEADFAVSVCSKFVSAANPGDMAEDS